MPLAENQTPQVPVVVPSAALTAVLGEALASACLHVGAWDYCGYAVREALKNADALEARRATCIALWRARKEEVSRDVAVLLDKT